MTTANDRLRSRQDDARILALRRQGMKLKDLAERFGCSLPRIRARIERALDAEADAQLRRERKRGGTV